MVQVKVVTTLLNQVKAKDHWCDGLQGLVSHYSTAVFPALIVYIYVYIILNRL